jgi:hypothetical protein
LDLKAAYHQLRIKKEDIYITSFCNPYSKTELDQFQFFGAPFGLSFLPSYFQGVISDVLKDIVGCSNYLDDINIYSEYLV